MSYEDVISTVKRRKGIAENIDIYDQDIEDYIEDGMEDMIASGVPKELIEEKKKSVITAITFYVLAHLGEDRSETELYMELYRKKVFRLTLEGDEDVE